MFVSDKDSLQRRWSHTKMASNEDVCLWQRWLPTKMAPNEDSLRWRWSCLKCFPKMVPNEDSLQWRWSCLKCFPKMAPNKDNHIKNVLLLLTTTFRCLPLIKMDTNKDSLLTTLWRRSCLNCFPDDGSERRCVSLHCVVKMFASSLRCEDDHNEDVCLFTAPWT